MHLAQWNERCGDRRKNVGMTMELRDVKVISTPGMLTDHYNPKNKTVNLSEGVYAVNVMLQQPQLQLTNVGHAVQHATGL